MTSPARWNDRAFLERLTDVERNQLPFAMASMLNSTAFGARKAVQGQMRGDFDRPTRYALRGVVVEKATKRDLRAKVVIHGDKAPRGGLPAAYFLGPQVQGGLRSHKAFELQLIARGMMQRDEVAVPAQRQKLNRYGNVSQGQLNRIMSGLGIDYRGAGATRVVSTDRGRARAARRGRYFVPKRGGHLAPGIYHVTPSGRRIYPVMLFVTKRAYRKRLDMHGAVERHARRNMARNFDAAFAHAMRTRRR